MCRALMLLSAAGLLGLTTTLLPAPARPAAAPVACWVDQVEGPVSLLGRAQHPGLLRSGKAAPEGWSSDRLLHGRIVALQERLAARGATGAMARDCSARPGQARC